MKRKFQFLQHLVSLLLVVTMLSQTTSVKAVDEIQPGVDYYIMNVETDQFLGAQNLFGVQATLSDDAGIFRFVPGTTEGAPGYNIVNTLVSVSNKNLGTNLYTDNNGLATVKDDETAGTTKSTDGIWTIEPQGGGIFAFRCVSEWKWENDAWVEIPHGYLCKSETAGYRKGFELMFSQELTDNCLFRVMTYDEALEYMVDKAQSSNVSFNFLIKNPDFSRNQSIADWKVSASCTNKNLSGFVGQNPNASSNFCAESWHSYFAAYQIVKDLPAGRYQLSAQGFYQADGTDAEDLRPCVYVGPSEGNPSDNADYQIIAKSILPLKTGTENNMATAGTSFQNGLYYADKVLFNLTEKTDLQVGFYCKSNTYWAIWDNVQLTYYHPAAGITVSPEAVATSIGKKHKLNAAVLPAAASQDVTWLSSNSEVATVDANGLVTAVSDGTATITATTADGTNLSATCEVTVSTVPATAVTLDLSELNLWGFGSTQQLQAAVSPDNASKVLTWTTSDENVATVDEAGLVTAVGSGAATITATTTDGTDLSAACEVNVAMPSVTSVTLNKAALFKTVGETYQLSATVLPVEARQTITWQSSNPEVATVDETGLVTAVGNGNATVTATTTDGTELFASCSVTVASVVVSGMCGVNVRYTLYDNMSLLIFGAGDMTSSPRNDSYSKDIKAVIIEEGVRSIGDYAFQGCSGLTSVTIGSSVTSIGSYAFSGCSGLTSITIPEGVRSIGESAFRYCPGLTSVTIGSSVTSIGSDAFSSCSGLKRAEFASIESFCKIAFGGDNSNPIYYTNHLYIDGQEVKDLVIPESVTSIGQYAFQGCSGLTSVTIPESVTSIGDIAFYGCSGLMSITIPNSVTSIGTNALNAPNLFEIKLQGSTPGTKGDVAFNADAFLYVPSEALDAYKTAWSDIADRIFTVDALTPVVVESTATDGKSALLDAIGGIGQESSIVSLKVRGSLNGYDIMLLRNKMTNLRYLDLSEARIVKEADNYEYYTGCYTEDDVLGANSFRDLQLLKVVLPKDITSIGASAFYGAHLLEVKGMPATCQTIGSSAFSGCSALQEVEIGSGVTSIGVYAFQDCSGLTSITMPNSVTRIMTGAFFRCTALKNIVFSRNLERIEGDTWKGCFEGCSSLEELRLPASLKYIGGNAFNGCSALKEVHIPSMMVSIGDNVFTSNSITDVYAYSLSPISIGQNTFNFNATLHAPQTPESVFNAYYYNTQWSQFTSVVDFQAEYSSWYAPEDYDIVVESGEEIPSEDKENGANGEMQPGSGLIYEDGSSQKLDELSMNWEDGKNYPSLIHNEDVDINSLSITLNVQKNKWYFFCFPFDIDLTTATYPSKHYVWRWYDGNERALHGVGGWKNTVGNTLTAGQGYIFQTNKAGELVLHIASPALGNGDTEVDLEAHASGELQDANWNFVGNKNLSYYDINALTEEFQSPITVWDAANSTYTAIVPGDDDYSFHPYEAFFVQKPNGKSKISFGGNGRETFSQKQKKEAEARAMVREADNNNPRKIINLTISDGAKTDKTRVVFNDERSESYEQECDASKFLSSGVPQIYTMDAKSVKYAINERDKGAGAVNIGYVVSEAGSYVIRAQRMDCPMALKDNVTGAVWKLSEGAYSFNTEAGTHEARFTLIPADEATSVNEVKTLGELSLSSVGGGIAVKGLNGKSLTVYGLGGAVIATADADGMVSLPAGVYVVSCDGKTVKMSVQ